MGRNPQILILLSSWKKAIRVCVGTECSLFYSKRFCLPCVNENLREFPLEIRQDLEKRKSHSKSHPSKKADART
ncbi:unnamed protein product [Caretta caretta]